MKKLKIIFVYIGLLLAAYGQMPTAQAQGPGFDEDVDDVPFDGGVSLVMAAAAGYGLKKLQDKRKK